MFHASNVDLKVGDYLDPAISRDRVYGTKEFFQCLVFGRFQSLRDFASDINSFKLKNGKLGIQYLEHFPRMFECDYLHKTAYVYELEDEGFEPGGWNVEWFSTKKVKIIGKQKVNLYDELMKNVELGHVQVDFYEETREHIEKVIKHLNQVLSRGDCEIDFIIKLAHDFKANAVEDYFVKLKKLNETTLQNLPSKTEEMHKEIT